mgnify:CR=1 FL=1
MDHPHRCCTGSRRTAGSLWAVVGAFTAEEPFSDLTDYALAAPTGADHVSFQAVRVLAPDVSSVRARQTAVLAVVDPAENDVRVQTASALSEQNRAVTGQLAGLGRSLLVLILGAGTGDAVLLSQGNGLGLDFVSAVAVLAALTAVAASLPPATFAAFRDPVRVMRTA